MKFISILDKYIIKKFLGTYIFSILLIISVAIVFDINEKIDKFIDKKAPLNAIIFDYYLNFIPYFANLFSALFVFISVIFFTSKLAENSEIIAMLSNGMSFKRLMKPYMISATVIAILSFVLSSFIIPPGNKKRIDFQNKYVKNKEVVTANRVQMQIAKGTILYLESFYKSSNSGRNMAIDHFDGRDLKSRLIANRIQYVDDGVWRVENYTIRDFEETRERITTGTQLDTLLKVKPADFLVAVNDFETMTSPELYQYINQQHELGLANVGGVSIKLFEVEFHKRFASMFSAFILTIIGAALSARKMKGGMGLNIGIGLALSVTYILFMTISSSFAVKGSWPVILAVWLPNIIYSFIAAYLYTKAPN